MRLILLLLFIIGAVSEPCTPSATGLVGAYSPQCNEDGTWVKLQCHGSIGYCWCVDSNTGEKTREPFRPWLSMVALSDQCNGI